MPEQKKYEYDIYYEFEFSAHGFNGGSTVNNIDEQNDIFSATSGDGYRMIVVVGDRFMNGIFIASEKIKQCYTTWNNTLHDINHMASGYKAGFNVIPPDIEYIIGWQDEATWDEITKEVVLTLHIEKDAPKFKSWENYINISKKINRTPNVSVVWFAKVEYIQAGKLPMGCGYEQAGYKENDLVPCMYSIKPFMVSTVTEGACNDKDGSGINSTCSIEKTKEEKNIEVESIDRSNKEKKEKLEHLKNRIKYLKRE